MVLLVFGISPQNVFQDKRYKLSISGKKNACKTKSSGSKSTAVSKKYVNINLFIFVVIEATLKKSSQKEEKKDNHGKDI